MPGVMKNRVRLARGAVATEARPPQLDRAGIHREEADEHRHLPQHRKQPLTGLHAFFFHSSKIASA